MKLYGNFKAWKQAFFNGHTNPKRRQAVKALRGSAPRRAMPQAPFLSVPHSTDN
jgi:hypothetical protein